MDSRDEIANLELASKLLRAFRVDDTAGWVEHTRDRPFNDRRYAVDGTKLRALGWKQRVPFDEGLAATVEWYAKFSQWWGPVDAILSPFPVVEGDNLLPATSKDTEAGRMADPILELHDQTLEKVETVVGARDDRVQADSNGNCESNGLHAGAKKRKVGEMA